MERVCAFFFRPERSTVTRRLFIKDPSQTGGNAYEPACPGLVSMCSPLSPPPEQSMYILRSAGWALQGHLTGRRRCH